MRQITSFGIRGHTGTPAPHFVVGWKFAPSRAQMRLARAAMAKRDTSVWVLCREFGIQPVTLYRYVGPQGVLREQGEKVLAT